MHVYISFQHRLKYVYKADECEVMILFDKSVG